jgi:hypothetical protein
MTPRVFPKQFNSPRHLAIDSFVSSALRANAPLTLITYPNGRHAFDALNDTEESRAIIKAAFGLVRAHTATAS